uniref:Uncharacterized protein n=1 Tax=viral metagenome TaxID=1070528 RepID=A0A6M3KT11_9ZZZZ
MICEECGRPFFFNQYYMCDRCPQTRLKAQGEKKMKNEINENETRESQAKEKEKWKT